MDQYLFPCDPIANPAAVVSGPNYRFTLLSEIVFRYEWAEDGIFEDRASAFAINRNFAPPKFTVNETIEHIELVARNFHITYDKKPFSRSGFIVGFPSKVTLWGADWRYGETAKDNLGGTARTLDEVNGRCDMGDGILSRSGFATVDDSDTMLFDGQGFVAPRRTGHRIDGYMFAYGHDYKGAMKAFYDISGHQPILPRWALGNWWSRYHPYSADEYINLMEVFRARSVPLSVAVVDMDWHQVKGDHIPHAGWTGYSWNKELFPDPAGFGQALHDRGLKITLNDHPHGGIHHHEDLYEAMAAALGHDTSKKAPILFNPTDPKFMDAFFRVLHSSIEKEACDFWWIDWQQGPISRVPGLDPLWLLNHFHFRDHVNKNGQGRGIIFSRYAGPGSHRYPVGFSGDSIRSWDSLRFQPEFTATASNIGYGWWSHDIGGHMGGIRDDEMATRWVQYGVFSPIFRLHSSNSQWTSKEPWNFRVEHCKVMEYFMRLRHRLVPYLHTVNLLGGPEPVARPLYWEYPAHEEAYEKPNEYFFGPYLIVAPIVEPRNPNTNLASVNVWVPPGRHVDIFTGAVYDGDQEIRMYRTIETIPVLAPEGSILPLGELNPPNGCVNPTYFEVLTILGKDGQFTILEDPNDDYETEGSRMKGDWTEYRKITLDYKQSEGRLRISKSTKTWMLRFPSVTIIPHGLEVRMGGVVIASPSVYVETRSDPRDSTADPEVPGLVVHIPRPENGEVDVEITLGPDPQLGVLDRASLLTNWLLDFQMEFAAKDRMLAAVEGKKPLSSKIGRLMSLGLGMEYIGPVVELLTADSR
ncbi:Glycoside hydrolase, family 31 [Metarhizium rileyi]|uniref:Glycoside hydrolase, family 31 n=1 Tax=Metarhizium rileyi (strain RCEF 4871) TaxID=1649241 RepID=A0A167A734_METRR|nr:Glycoside hydrolase, family 31 [Metarhizium rileyi RCEF 4871]